MTTPADAAPTFFADAGHFRAWLAKQANTASELDVGFHKVGSGRPSMTWPEAVDEALCAGWIDGVRRRIDDHAYRIRFTPRKASSIWSTINIGRAQALIAAGRMQDGGLAAFARRTAERSSVYAYEQREPPQLTADDLRQFKRSKGAWAYLQAAPPGYRRVMTHWVTSAKQPATRARRLDQYIAACAAGIRLR